MADRYVSFESLLATDRVVRLSGSHLRVSEAGYNPRRFWLKFHDKKTARRAGGSLLVHLREKRAKGELKTDLNYNMIVVNWVEQLADGGYLVKKEVGGENDD